MTWTETIVVILLWPPLFLASYVLTLVTLRKLFG
jgi:hypothetical protein